MGDRWSVGFAAPKAKLCANQCLVKVNLSEHHSYQIGQVTGRDGTQLLFFSQQRRVFSFVQ